MVLIQAVVFLSRENSLRGSQKTCSYMEVYSYVLPRKSMFFKHVTLFLPIFLINNIKVYYIYIYMFEFTY